VEKSSAPIIDLVRRRPVKTHPTLCERGRMRISTNGKEGKRGRGGEVDEEKRGNVPLVVLVLLVALCPTKHSSAGSERFLLPRLNIVLGGSYEDFVSSRDRLFSHLLVVVVVVGGH
jgi:hypothetical protein